MTREEVQAVVEALKAEGVEVGPHVVRERLGRGSFRDIVRHLRSLGEGSPLPPGAGEEEGDDADAGDVVVAAEAQVAQAQRRLQALEDAEPLAREVVAQTLSTLLNASGRELTVQNSVRRGWLPQTHPRVGEAEASHRAAGLAFRAATQRLEALPREIAQAQAAVRVAEREAYLAREHAALVERRAALQAEAPVDGDEPGASYRARAIWKQQLAGVQAEIDTVLAQAGL